MTSEIAVAFLALVGTLVGTFGGIVTSSKLTAYRIEQLERKVDKHNNFASRIPVIEHDLQACSERIDEIERRVYH